MENKESFPNKSVRNSIDKLQELSDVSGVYGSIRKLQKKDILSPTLSQMDLIEPPKLDLASFKLPELGKSPFAEELDKICEFNCQMVDANKELLAKLSASEASHRYDWIKEVLIAIVSAFLGALFAKLMG